MSFSEAEYQQLLRNKQGRIATPKASKYKAVKTTVDGITFDSKKEAQRYHELRLMEKAGQIHGLVVHPKLPLEVAAPDERRRIVIGFYEGDFQYFDSHGADVIEDVKGMATLPLAKWKQRHLKAQYGITVREIR